MNKKNEKVLLFAGIGALVAVGGLVAYEMLGSQNLPQPDTSSSQTTDAYAGRTIASYQNAYTDPGLSFAESFLARLRNSINPVTPVFGVDATKTYVGTTDSTDPTFGVGTGNLALPSTDPWTTAGSADSSNSGVTFGAHF